MYYCELCGAPLTDAECHQGRVCRPCEQLAHDLREALYDPREDYDAVAEFEAGE